MNLVLWFALSAVAASAQMRESPGKLAARHGGYVLADERIAAVLLPYDGLPARVEFYDAKGALDCRIGLGADAVLGQFQWLDNLLIVSVSRGGRTRSLIYWSTGRLFAEVADSSLNFIMDRIGDEYVGMIGRPRAIYRWTLDGTLIEKSSEMVPLIPRGKKPAPASPPGCGLG